jgi:predicted  nucleic acid-binding Zn-ribbon protein
VESKTSRGRGALPMTDTSEAAIAELADEVEHLRDELMRMRAKQSTLERERERLEGELAQARQWVKILAREIEETDARLSAEARPLSARIARTD